jgi:DUF2946 family protein
MYTRSLNPTQRQWIFSILLLALLVRALVPAGFMPSSEQPFSFQICPDGFPAQLLHSADAHQHHHHPGGDDQTNDDRGGPHEHGVRAEHCVFAAAATVGALSQVALLLTPLEQQAAPHFYTALPIPELTRHRVQQPRAPPAFS